MNELAALSSQNDKLITLDVTIDPNRPLTASLANNAGSVTVVSGEGSSVHIEVEEVSRKDSDIPLKEAVVISVTDNDITVRPNFQFGSTLHDIAGRVKDQLKHGFDSKSWDFKQLKAVGDIVFDIRVTVPAKLADDSRLSIKTASGAAKSQDFDGSINVATASGGQTHANVGGHYTGTSASGSINIRQIKGNVECNTASGGITVSGVNGWIAARSVSGAVHVDDAVIKGGRFNSVSGELNVTATFDNQGTYSAETVSGASRFNVTVPSEGAVLEFRSISGSSHVGADWQATAKRDWKIGEGTGPTIKVKSVSGALHSQARVDPSLTLTSETRNVSVPGDDEADEWQDSQNEQADAANEQRDHENAAPDFDQAKRMVRKSVNG